ncbi:MAG: zinc-binding alcohol dehydrogenase [Planctomycetota bacterium]|nr:zinc-binding alcohol dehydrogenase [Planctomycetota bacterium]
MPDVGTTEAYWVTAPGHGELRREAVNDNVGTGESLVQALYSGVSPGTERLVGRGEVPTECHATMACHYMAGGFELPIKYGYSLVARGIDGELDGKNVFVMHPHQELARIDNENALVLPETLPPHRATLIPNTETALNAIWDAELEAGQSSVIVGAGPVGLLLAFVLHRLGLGPTHIVETDDARRTWADTLPFVDAIGTASDFRDGHYRVAFHSSGHGAGLQSALSLIGFEGSVIELSWYGNRPVEVDLGSHFHYQRKRIVASQVGHVARPRRQDTSHSDRLQEVLCLLEDASCDQLLGQAVDFASMPQMMAELYQSNLSSPCPLIRYP